jgi:hypothetical protein
VSERRYVRNGLYVTDFPDAAQPENSRRKIIHQGHYMTIWSDGSWHHVDGRFLSMAAEAAPRLLAWAEEAHPPEDVLDSMFLHWFIYEHVKANPQKYR